MKLRCQYISLPGNQCSHSTFQGGMYCRWHKILIEFRNDFQKRKWAGQIMMVGVYSFLGLSIYALTLFTRSHNYAFIFLFFFAACNSLKFFSDSIMALNYPLSHFALWPKMLALGLALEIISVASVVYIAAVNSSFILPLVHLILSDKISANYGPAIFSTAAIAYSCIMAYLLAKRILFIKWPFLGMFLFFIWVSLSTSVFKPILTSKIPIIPQYINHQYHNKNSR